MNSSFVVAVSVVLRSTCALTSLFPSFGLYVRFFHLFYAIVRLPGINVISFLASRFIVISCTGLFMELLRTFHSSLTLSKIGKYDLLNVVVIVLIYTTTQLSEIDRRIYKYILV